MALFGCDWDSYYEVKKENEEQKKFIVELKKEIDWLFNCLESSEDAVLELNIIKAFRNRHFGSNKIKIRTKDDADISKIKKYCNQEKSNDEHISSIEQQRLPKDWYGFSYENDNHLLYETTVILSKYSARDLLEDE